MVDMLLEIDESYQEFLVYEKGQKVLCVHILRAICGVLMSGILFYKKFRKALEAKTYEVNPYDPCVTNKIVNGTQHTVCWHVNES